MADERELDEFVLPYELVRTAPNLDALLLEFLQSSYEAAVVAANADDLFFEIGERPTIPVAPMIEVRSS